jgi:hypothetical protein
MLVISFFYLSLEIRHLRLSLFPSWCFWDFVIQQRHREPLSWRFVSYLPFCVILDSKYSQFTGLINFFIYLLLIAYSYRLVIENSESSTTNKDKTAYGVGLFHLFSKVNRVPQLGGEAISPTLLKIINSLGAVRVNCFICRFFNISALAYCYRKLPQFPHTPQSKATLR